MFQPEAEPSSQIRPGVGGAWCQPLPRPHPHPHGSASAGADGHSLRRSGAEPHAMSGLLAGVSPSTCNYVRRRTGSAAGLSDVPTEPASPVIERPGMTP